MNFFKPLEVFADWLVQDIFNLTDSHMAHALDFFIYDSLKIIFLMILITHFMSLLRFYLPIEKLRDFLVKHKMFGLDYFLASIFGAITPFCSCSSIPLFIGFLEARIPLGVTFSFLITSPLINEVAIGLFAGLFGFKITAFYVLAGILIGVVGGFVIEKLKMEKYVAEFIWDIKSNKLEREEIKNSFGKVLKTISREAWGITRKVIVYVLVGVAVGGSIHGYVPAGFFEKYLQFAGYLGVPLAVILAVPLYSNASGVIPVLQSLIAKGIPMGTGLAFMMATVGLSFPEALILKKVLKWQLLVTFFGIVTMGIIIIGCLFNLFL